MSSDDRERYEYRNSPSYQDGLDVLARTGGGPDGIQQWAAVHSAIGPKIDQLLGEFCFGTVWARSALDDRAKRLVTLAIIAAIGADMPLRAHIALARDQGISVDEILDVFVHLIAYAGFPRGLSAIALAREVFDA